jgi:FKBP-type peptidyl-prolyl cis-trans isomerase FkpA
MKKTTTILLGAFILLAAGACSPGGGFKKTKSGLMYKIISKGNGSTVKKGDYLKLNYTQKVRDSVISSSLGGLPTFAAVDSVGPVYNPAEIFTKLRKGDSAVVVMLADSLARKQGALPPFIKKNDKFTLTLKVLEVYHNEADVRKDQMTILDQKKEDEINQIKKYLDEKHIKAEKSTKGVFVEIEKQGDGPKVDSGKAVHVKYKGMTFQGKVFDSNLDSTFHHPEPFVFVVGQRGSIEGWDDGLRLLNKGGKAKLYIPSMLAYGPTPPQGAPFKAYENLIFDVEVLDVTTPEPRSAMQRPGLPPQLQEQLQRQQQLRQQQQAPKPATAPGK